MKVKGFLTSIWSDTFGRMGREGCSLQDFQIDLTILRQRAGWQGHVERRQESTRLGVTADMQNNH